MATVELIGLNLHPVKACRRVEVREATVSAAGLVGDREWQVFSDEGKVLTQRRHPALALVQPELIGGGLRLSAPGHGTIELDRPARADRVVTALLGDRVEVGDGGDEAAGWFSAVTGTECRLVALCTPVARRLELVSAQAMNFADATPVLVANEASLRDLAGRAVEPFGMDRFRANLVVDGAEPWAEDTWASFTIGGARLETVIPVPRCTVPQVDQDTGKRRTEPARALRAHRWCTGAPSLPDGWQRFFNGQPLFGIGATIAPVGTVVRVGDPVDVLSTVAPLIAPPTPV